jgi:hypothetical protein
MVANAWFTEFSGIPEIIVNQRIFVTADGQALERKGHFRRGTYAKGSK